MFGMVAVAGAQPAELGDPADAPAASKVVEREAHGLVALAVNAPFQWPDGGFAASGYAAFKQHHALRFNVATFPHRPVILGEAIAIAAGGDGSEASMEGRKTDVGIGWQYFPRRHFDGFVLEAGLVRRSIETREQDENASPGIEMEDQTAYAVRGLVGWSWLIDDRVFVATSVGVSVGRYTGTTTTAEMTYQPQYETREVDKISAAPEFYLRIGIAFGL